MKQPSEHIIRGTIEDPEIAEETIAMRRRIRELDAKAKRIANEDRDAFKQLTGEVERLRAWKEAATAFFAEHMTEAERDHLEDYISDWPYPA